MGRAPRADVAGGIYHMLNRANRRAKIFKKDADYEAFEEILTDAVARYELELFSYCLMPNHWHLCVRPLIDGEMSRFAQWLGLTHTQRYNVHYKTVGEGHLYQGRYKSFPIQADEHFLTVCRYVERNAYTAELCATPETWRYSSLYRWKSGTKQEKSLLTKWPVARRPGWAQHVESALSSKEVKRLEWSEKRGCPYGDESWVELTARKFGLEMTMRPRGRPRKVNTAAGKTL
jgi:putative transposase